MKSCPEHDRNWETLVSMFPSEWERLSRTCGAFHRCREFQTPEALLRTFLLYVANGYSLRETVTVAREAGLASVSDTALNARFQRAERWLQTLCQHMFREMDLTFPSVPQGLQMRLIDGTIVKEPGAHGTQWCLHFSVQVPILRYDFTTITTRKGAGTGESLTHFPITQHECLIADRAYSKAPGIAHAATQGGVVIIRLNTGSLPLGTRQEINLPKCLPEFLLCCIVVVNRTTDENREASQGEDHGVTRADRDDRRPRFAGVDTSTYRLIAGHRQDFKRE